MLEAKYRRGQSSWCLAPLSGTNVPKLNHLSFTLLHTWSALQMLEKIIFTSCKFYLDNSQSSIFFPSPVVNFRFSKKTKQNSSYIKFKLLDNWTLKLWLNLPETKFKCRCRKELQRENSSVVYVQGSSNCCHAGYDIKTKNLFKMCSKNKLVGRRWPTLPWESSW